MKRHRNLHRLTAVYVFGLALIGVFTLATHAFVSELLRLGERSTSIVSLAGRQAEMSQRLAFLTELYVAPRYNGDTGPVTDKAALRETIEGLLASMRTEHAALRDGGRALVGFADPSEEVDDIYYGQPHRLEERLQTYFANIETVLAIGADGLDPNNPRLRAIQDAALDGLLTGLAAAADAYQRDSERRIFVARSLLLTFVIAILFLIVVEALLLFRPEVGRLRRFHEEVQSLAERDSLTGCLNRRAFLQFAAEAADRASERGVPFSVLAIDVDHFKRVNDTYGHAAGDAALKSFVGVIAKEVRENDLVGRLGGEEFAVALPAIAEAEAAGVAERIRLRLRSTSMTYDGATIVMTASVGVAQRGRDLASLDDCIRQADACLYAAKGAGRDQVVRASKLQTPQGVLRPQATG